VTIGLVWVLLSDRRLRDSERAEPAPVEFPADPGVRAEHSRRLTPPAPLAADHRAALGKTLRLGSLEVTPLAVERGRVELERALEEPEVRDGGADALTLRLRLKNVSSDAVFAPLDEAFLRESLSGQLDSLIENERKEQISMFPLAVTSEWSIRGQEFRDLRPGESFVGLVVSTTDVADRLTDTMTWRVRLRTGIGQTDTVGVEFHKAEIAAGP
jgi:hypothetical protein